QEMEAIGRQVVGDRSGQPIICERSIEMRLAGQGCECAVPLPEGDLSKMPRETLRKLFDDVYVSLFGRTYPDAALELVTFNAVVRLPSRPLKLPRPEPGKAGLEQALKGTRNAYSPASRGYAPHKVYDRYRLFPGAVIKGPAIIEEGESTTIVGSDGTAT